MKKMTLPIAIALLTLLSACGTAPAEPEDSPETPPVMNPTQLPASTPRPSETPAPSPTPTSPPTEREINPLSGLRMDESAYGRRPVAVMLNNIKAALPMYGQSRADIIYEVMAEGGITRMLAIYQDPPDVPRIGSVRSTRSYYLDLAQGHDALLLHAGASEMAYADIRTRGVDNFDGVNGPYEGTLYWRDKDRIRTVGLEHSMFTSGVRIRELLASTKTRTALREDFTLGWRFSENASIRNGDAARTVTIKFSSYKTGVFTYDAEKARYLVSQYGKPYVDGETGGQVETDNVLGLFADIGLIRGDAYDRLYAKLVGEGDGFYANGGVSMPIRWSKESFQAPFVFTTADGEPLVMRPGQSYINVIGLKTPVTLE